MPLLLAVDMLLKAQQTGSQAWPTIQVLKDRRGHLLMDICNEQRMGDEPVD